MGMFDELNCMIEFYTKYDRETGENEEQFNNMNEEINMHLNGELEYDQLSPDAKTILKDWENLVADMQAFESERVGPLDV